MKTINTTVFTNENYESPAKTNNKAKAATHGAKQSKISKYRAIIFERQMKDVHELIF